MNHAANQLKAILGNLATAVTDLGIGFKIEATGNETAVIGLLSAAGFKAWIDEDNGAIYAK